MAATNFTPIQLYHSTTAAAVPVNTNLVNGELAINITDGKLYYKDNGGTVQVIATKATGTIGGSDTQVQYNSSGALAGSSNFTFNGTTATINTLNLTNALGATYGGTAQSSWTTGDLLYASGSNTLAKLGIGLNTYILTSNGSIPGWAAPSAISVNTATNLAGGAAGSVPYQSGAGATTFLSIGTANQVITSSGSAPQWSSGLSITTLTASDAVTFSATTQNIALGTSQTSGTFTVGGAAQTGTQTVDQSTKTHTLNIGTGATESGATKTINIGTGGVSTSTTAINIGSANGTTISFAANPVLSGGTANGVLYLNASKVATSGSALTFDGTKFTQTASTTGILAEFKNSASNAQNGNIVAANDAGTALRVQVFGSAAGTAGMLSAGSPVIYTSATELNLVTDNAAGVIKFATGGLAEKMRLDASGNLLVGLTSALANGKLQIAGGIGLSGNTQIRQATNSDGNTLQLFATQVVVGASNAQSYNYSGGGLLASVSTSAAAVLLDVGGATAGQRLKVINDGTGSQGYLDYSDAGTSRFYVNSATGNVGIGTNSPDGKLDIAQAMTNGATGAFTSPHLALTATSATDTTGFVGMTMATSDSANYGYSYGALRGSGGVGDLVWRFHANSAAGTQLMRLDYTGNLGLGVTPSAWDPIFRVQQIGLGAFVSGRTDTNSQVQVGCNAYYDDVDNRWEYISSGFASRYYQDNSVHVWETAPSWNGTGSNAISFTQAMTLDASGDLAIGTTTGSIFATSGVNVSVSNPSGIATIAIAGSTGNSGYLELGQGSVRGALIEGTTNAMIFYTNATGSGTTVTERARITSTGNFGIGTNDPNSFGKLAVVDTNRSGTALFVVRDEGTPSVDLVSISANALGTALSVNSVGNTTALNIGVGGTAPTTSGTGITFPATQSPSSDANTLDDYEEGVHTAVVTCSTSGTVTLNSSIDVLSYTKIGRQVTVTGLLSVSSVSSPVGYFTVSLPFAIGDLSELSGRAAGSISIGGVVSANISDFMIIALESDSFFRVYLGDATNFQADSAEQLQTSSEMYISFTYFV